jgi:Fe2+ transport system protein FeoA
MPKTTRPVAAHVPLASVPVGVPHIIERVDGPAREELAREGVLPGGVVVVMARMPLGGPLVVELGGTRLALSADVAAGVATVVAPRAPGADG